MKKDEKKVKPVDTPLLHSVPDKEKDPYRWVTIVMLLVILFVTYVFWMQGK